VTWCSVHNNDIIVAIACSSFLQMQDTITAKKLRTFKKQPINVEY